MIHRNIVNFLLVSGLFVFSCEKQNASGSLLATFKSHGGSVPFATIYIKYGTNNNPNIPLSQYDQSQRADGTGQVYFNELLPGDYYLFAMGFDAKARKMIKGDTSIKVRPRSRQNIYEVTIEAK